MNTYVVHSLTRTRSVLVSMPILSLVLVLFVASTSISASNQAFSCNYSFSTGECVFRNISLTSCNANFTAKFALRYFVKKIRFENSTIPKLCSDICAEFPSLIDLEIEDVGLQSLSPDVFRSCRYLRSLSLFRNLLTSMPIDIFKPLSSLTKLDIGQNRWRCLSPTWFWSLRNLQEFQSCCSPIKQFPADLLLNSTKLELLSLHNNILSDLPAEQIIKNYRNLCEVLYNGNDFPCLRAVEINEAFRAAGVIVNTFTDGSIRQRFAPILNTSGIECFSDWAWAPNNYDKSVLPVYPNLCHLRSSN